jgi:hypothetical protein
MIDLLWMHHREILAVEVKPMYSANPLERMCKGTRKSLKCDSMTQRLIVLQDMGQV